ncbi:hypothetical protein NDU88_010793 [Pleurodeles waltl]|uniref:Uncharacterized protein n=1 Tax=Pleurodeles waltl TaxID=8319 RepID=A0AAV7PZY7_PLEWA|nr:hypothetical protein NDU88_010793 [Pleurodeles waltl]
MGPPVRPSKICHDGGEGGSLPPLGPTGRPRSFSTPPLQSTIQLLRYQEQNSISPTEPPVLGEQVWLGCALMDFSGGADNRSFEIPLLPSRIRAAARVWVVIAPS